MKNKLQAIFLIVGLLSGLMLGYQNCSQGFHTTVRGVEDVEPMLTTAIQLSTNSLGYHTCAVLTTSELECCGSNWSGQLGDGTTVKKLSPVSVIASGVNLLSAQSEYTCAIVSSVLKCWGWNPNELLGYLNYSILPMPVLK